MLENQIPRAPVEMVMSPYYPYILAISGAIFLAALGYAGRDAIQTRRWLPVLVFGGAFIASFQEAIYDVSVLVWWAENGPAPLYRAYNISVPTWMALAYPWFIGGMGYWAYRQFNDGMTPTKLWKLYFFGWFANMVLEIPALQLGNIYTYYGNQPFVILGFPMWMAFTNTLMPILVGAALHSLDDILKGPRALLVLAIVPMCTSAAEIASGWPIWFALNSGMTSVGTHVAALVVLGLSLTITYLVSLKFCTSAETRVVTQPVAQFETA